MSIIDGNVLKNHSNFSLFNFSNQNIPELRARSARLVSNNSYQNYRSAIAIDSNNITHCVWYAYTNYYNQVLLYANSSDNFSSVQTISSIYNPQDPNIAVDSSNIVHIVWGTINGIYYTNSSVNYTIHKIVSLQSYTNCPEIFCDNSSIVHVAWEGYAGNNWEIFYANSSNYFSTNKLISNSSFDEENADVCVHDGIVHIVWMRKINFWEVQIIYSNSTDDFTTKKIISKSGSSHCAPRMAFDNSGELHIVWHGIPSSINTDELLFLLFIYFYLPYFNDAPYLPPNFDDSIYSFYYYSSLVFPFIYDTRTYYSNSTNDFQTVIDISKSVASDVLYPDLAIDSDGVCHIVFCGDFALFLSFLYYTNSSTNFQSFKSYSLLGFSGYPRIANGTNDEIYFVFMSSHSIYCINSSDLGPWKGYRDPSWKFFQIYSAIPKMPNTALITVLMLLILGGFNVAAILIFKHKEKEAVPGAPKEKRTDEGKSGTKKKVKGDKIIVEKNGKKVKVKLP